MSITLKKLVEENGVGNLLFTVPIVFFYPNTKKKFSVECVIDERRYKASEGYKIGLRTKQKFAISGIFGGIDLDHLYFDTYQMDFMNMVGRDAIQVVKNVQSETVSYNTEYMIAGFRETLKKLKPDDVKALKDYIAARNTKVA